MVLHGTDLLTLTYAKFESYLVWTTLLRLVLLNYFSSRLYFMYSVCSALCSMQ